MADGFHDPGIMKEGCDTALHLVVHRIRSPVGQSPGRASATGDRDFDHPGIGSDLDVCPAVAEPAAKASNPERVGGKLPALGLTAGLTVPTGLTSQTWLLLAWLGPSAPG
jgi:hypothetical protein